MMESVGQAAHWYLVLMTASWAFAPLTRFMARGLPDRGAAIARPVALLALLYPTWLLSSVDLIPFTTAALWMTILLGGLVGWLIAFRAGAIERRWIRSLLTAELIALLAFAAYVWLRGYTPAILGTEKPMDIAMLASSTRAITMPPTDPWYAGQPVNYYYLGYAIYGSITRLTAIPATVGFNLALATTFSMTVTAAAGLGFNIVRRWLSHHRSVMAGAVGGFAVALAGNLYAPLRLVRTPSATWHAWWWDTAVGIGWRSSRIVCDGPRLTNACRAPSVETINEFPSFSFLLGDLHPHVMALPFTIAVMSLAIGLVQRGGTVSDVMRWGRTLGAVRIALIGAMVGSLYALNSWDYPTFLLLSMAALWAGTRGERTRDRGLAIMLLISISVVAWLPFIRQFAPPTAGDVTQLPGVIQRLPALPGLLTAVGVQRTAHTSVGEFLTIFGIPYLVCWWLLITRRGKDGRATIARPELDPPVIGFCLVLATVAILIPMPLLIICGLPLLLAVARLRADLAPTPRTVATTLFATGLSLVLLTECFFLQDTFGDRMNTLFKVYYQVWTLFGIATGVSVMTLWREARPRRLARPALALFGLAALIASVAYPVLASRQWTAGAEWSGLDGLAYSDTSAPDERAAIEWLRRNAVATDVIAEAPGCSYQPNGELPFDRASAYSGVPTVIGWQGHEKQWRSGQPALLFGISTRIRDIAAIFDAPESPLVTQYGVSLLYVGRYETEDHDCLVAGPYEAVRGSAYPGPNWSMVFDSGDVRVFRRTEPGESLAAWLRPVAMGDPLAHAARSR